jgi:hypothetical protein
MIIVPHSKITVLGAVLKKCVQVELQATLIKDKNLSLWANGDILLRNIEENTELRIDKPFAGGFYPTIIDCSFTLSEILRSFRGQGIERIGDQLMNLALLKWMTLYFYMRPNQAIDHTVWLKCNTRGVNLDGTTSYKDQALFQSFFSVLQT